MISTVISLIVTLAIVVIVYLLVKWAVGLLGIASPLPRIVDIIFAVIAIILVLKYLITLI